MEEMTGIHGGGSEEEFAQLKRSKIEAEKLCKEQEEELDEMAGQIQLLEQAKLRLGNAILILKFLIYEIVNNNFFVLNNTK